ncbi:MAG: homoserine kinase [Mariprofundaceae bacterium]
MSVYTELSRADIARILADYDLGELRDFAGIADGIENTNYFLDTDRGRFVLTVFERMDVDDLPYFMALMHHLAGAGFPCPDVMRRQDGAMLFTIQAGGMEKRGCIVSRLPGWTLDELGEAQLRASGYAMGALHLAGADFPLRRANPTDFDWLRQTVATMRDAVAARDGIEALRLLESELEWQAGQDFAGLPAGVIHGDLFTDNILFEGDQVSGVIDFYYAHDAPYAMDVAIALNAQAVLLRSADEDAARMRAFLEGYEQMRRLREDERAALPGLLRRAALRFWVSRLHDAIFPREGAMTQIKDPEEYRRKLAFHRGEGLDG